MPCIKCLTAENARLRADNLQLVNNLESEGARVGMLTAENARVIAERDGLQRALDVSKDTAAGFMSTEQLRVFLGVVRIAIAACAPPASGEGERCETLLGNLLCSLPVGHAGDHRDELSPGMPTFLAACAPPASGGTGGQK